MERKRKYMDFFKLSLLNNGNFAIFAVLNQQDGKDNRSD